MKIELISPAAEENARVPGLALPTLAALTPPDVDITFTDDLLTPIDLDRGLKEADLVGITVLTTTALRAYAIADAYRRRGTPVVLGGIHPTALPEEAGEHADSVVTGEAEEIWPQVVEDARAGRLQALYRQSSLTEPHAIPIPRRSILPLRGYLPVDVVQVSRGCPLRCEFCSVRNFYGDTYRLRPIDRVIQEVGGLRHRYIMFNDDNIVGDPAYARELFSRLAPLGKKWVGQASLSGLKQAAAVASLKQSGCIALMIGFESLSRSNLIRSGKYQNDPTAYREVIERLHRAGILIWGSFIFGLDEDTPDALEETVRFAVEAKLFSAVFAILTPYPHTAFYDRVKEEGRLVEDRWWLLENPEKTAPHFMPVRMSREALREAWEKAWKDYYSFSSILKRFQWNYPPTLINRLVYFPFQWMQRRFTRKKILEGRRRFRKGSF